MSTQETGLDWIIFLISHQAGWIEYILNFPDYLAVNINQQKKTQIKFQVWNPKTRSRLKISFRNVQPCLP